MARRPRKASATAFFHVVNRAARKQKIFLRPQDYRGFIDVLAAGLKRHPVRLISFCIMANHWHLVVGPTETRTLSSLLHWVTTTHAVRLNHRRKTIGQGPVYQGRFRSDPVETTGDLMRVCRYVERNALRQNLVARAEDWEWGSLHARCNDYYPIPLSRWPIPPPSDWIELVNTSQTDSELADLRNCVKRDQPIGGADWVKAVAPFVGMTLKAVGRPKK